jgi:hypothetical protein
MDKILIAGAGQLGSRYLQGLAQCSDVLEIYVYDISDLSLKTASQRWCECEKKNQHKVFFVSSLKEVPLSIDIAVVSSTANVRLAIVNSISQGHSIKYWILEKVLSQSVGDNHKIRDLLKNSHGAWVNTPRYLSPLYFNLRGMYPDRPPIKVAFNGISGLACNAIHYIDLVARWAGIDVSHVDVSGLGGWFEAKRPGFYEVSGVLRVLFEDDSVLTLSSENHNQDGGGAIFVVGGYVWRVFENQGYALSEDGSRIDGDIGLQSEITAGLVNSILSSGACNLPSLEESIQAHNVFIDALAGHWSNFSGSQTSIVPIT